MFIDAHPFLFFGGGVEEGENLLFVPQNWHSLGVSALYHMDLQEGGLKVCVAVGGVGNQVNPSFPVYAA